MQTWATVISTAFTILYFVALAIEHLVPSTSIWYQLANWLLTGPLKSEGQTTTIKKSPTAPITMLAVLSLLFLSGCSLFHGISGVGSSSADVTITLPDGTKVGATIAGSQACLADQTGFVKFPFFNIECSTVCGQVINGGWNIQLMCRLAGTTTVFPISFALPSAEQQKAAVVAKLHKI